MNKNEYKDIWVWAENEKGKLETVVFELCSELRKMCDISGDKLCVVAAGKVNDEEIEKLTQYGVNKLYLVNGYGYDRYNTEAYTNLFTVMCNKYKPSAVFVGATVNGRDFAPRFAARLETGCTSDATELIYNKETGDIEFVEPAAGGKIMAVITIPVLRPQVGTIRPGTFKCSPLGKKDDFQIINEEISIADTEIRTKLLEYVPDEFDPELQIADCDVIVCIGNGVKDESLDLYKKLAELLNGKLAGTRPVVDRELLPYKLQVGQSGVMIKPKLYIGFGISGAVNHVIGVDAEKFIAVNKDPNAPIFNYCDYGVVGDMDEICKAMIEELENNK